MQVDLPASIGFSEAVLAGLVGPNVANLAGAAAGNTFEVPGVVIFYAMAQYEILSPRGRPDRIGLNKTHAIEGGFQCSRRE